MSELILRTRELTRRYGRTLALDRASLSVEKGQLSGGGPGLAGDQPDQGGLARSQKAGNQIHISHHVLL